VIRAAETVLLAGLVTLATIGGLYLLALVFGPALSCA
jgi:hypothetical protein